MEASDATFIACRFSRNIGGQGGAILCENSLAPAFIDCSFSDNRAATGAGLQVGLSSPVFTRCTFSGNQASANGGGLFIFTDSAVRIESCTLSGNGAATRGGGLYVWDASVELRNSIIAYSTAGESIEEGYSVTVTLTCCDLFGNAGGDWIGTFADQLGQNGNINLDPLFCGPEETENPYMLWSDSPCAEAHNPTCGRIGAWPIGCGAATVEEPAAGRIGLRVASPSSGATTLRYELPASTAHLPVRLDILDLLGRRLATLASGPQPAGPCQVHWDGRDAGGQPVPAGVYLARLRAGREVVSRGIVRLK